MLGEYKSNAKSTHPGVYISCVIRPFLSLLLLRGKFKRYNGITQGVPPFRWTRKDLLMPFLNWKWWLKGAYSIVFQMHIFPLRMKWNVSQSKSVQCASQKVDDPTDIISNVLNFFIFFSTAEKQGLPFSMTRHTSHSSVKCVVYHHFFIATIISHWKTPVRNPVLI